MRVINKTAVESHKKALEDMKTRHRELEAQAENQAPQPVEITQYNPDVPDVESEGDTPGEAPPMEINGLFVMPGDYYSEDGFVISKNDIGENGAWSEVS